MPDDECQGGLSADQMLAGLWDRLARASPPLGERRVPPNAQDAERLVDASIELVRFADELDKFMRPFLSKYTQHHGTVKAPWEGYAMRDDIHTTAFQTVAPNGRPVALLKMRLRVLQQWVEALMIGLDSVKGD